MGVRLRCLIIISVVAVGGGVGGESSPRPKKPRQILSNVKVMLIAFFFNWKIIDHHEFVPRGETVNKEFYL